MNSSNPVSIQGKITETGDFTAVIHANTNSQGWRLRTDMLWPARMRALSSGWLTSMGPGLSPRRVTILPLLREGGTIRKWEFVRGHANGAIICDTLRADYAQFHDRHTHSIRHSANEEEQ
jgi:hypothetical protein